MNALRACWLELPEQHGQDELEALLLRRLGPPSPARGLPVQQAGVVRDDVNECAVSIAPKRINAVSSDVRYGTVRWHDEVHGAFPAPHSPT